MPLRVLTAPDDGVPLTGPTLFLAGGITGAPDWQTSALEFLKEACPKHSNLSVFNPRQRNFPIEDKLAGHLQIAWEFHRLRVADAILFWFPPEAKCEITLFELGSWLPDKKPLFVACPEEFHRSFDVYTQSRLARPLMPIHQTLDEVLDIAWEFFFGDT